MNYNNSNSKEADQYDSLSDSEDSLSSEDSRPWQDVVAGNGELFYVETNDGSSIMTDAVGTTDGLDKGNGNTFASTEFSLHGQQPTPLKNVHVNVKPAHYYNDRRSSTYLESMLGIISSASTKKVVVSALIPYGIVTKSERVNIGDTLIALNDVPVSTVNIEQVLSSVPHAMQLKLTFSNERAKSSPALIDHLRTEREANQAIVKLLHYPGGNMTTDESTEDYNSVFYLSLSVDSETAAPEEDIKYTYPTGDASAARRLKMVRGIFTTLADILRDAFSSCIVSSSLKVENSVVHCGYYLEENHLFVLCLNGEEYTASEVSNTVVSCTKLLKFMFGSLYRAFNRCNTVRLNHFFQLVLFCHEHGVFDWPNQLKLDVHTQVDVDAAVSEMEAGDFEDGYTSMVQRRAYVFAGSCLFFKEMLTCNHMTKEELQNVTNFVKSFNLLKKTTDENCGQLIIWREVFPWLQGQSNDTDEFIETRGRCFLLVVGLRGYLLCSLLEVASYCARATGAPGPHHMYVNLLRSTILRLEASGVTNSLNNARLSLSEPSICNTDALLKKQSLFGSNATKPPSGNTVTPSSGGGGLKIPFKSLTRKSSKGDLSKTEMSPQNSPSSRKKASSKTGDSPRFQRSGSQKSIASDDSGAAKKRQLGFSLGDLQRVLISPQTNNNIDQSGKQCLTRGRQNTLFNYIHMDMDTGIFISPNGEDMNNASGTFQDVIAFNFQRCVKVIKQRFDRNSQISHKTKLCKTIEEGILFQCQKSDSNKKSPLRFWVVGRRQFHPSPTEAYVCFHDSAKQNMVELAFELGFARPLS